MRKRVLAVLLTAAMGCTVLAGCSDTKETTAASTKASESADKTDESKPSSEEGKVFNIYVWNEEFKGFFEKYYKVPDGVTVNWIQNPSDNGVYQQKLDEALAKQATAAADDKIDMFLAEADYILKYVDSEYTMDVKSIGVNDFSQMYDYTVQACTDKSGVVKGVSFQCCPSALIYRRSIAKDVLGTDDPDEVQSKLDSWEKFDAVAADAKAKGYYMTGSFAETYRPFSNNCSAAWVDDKNTLHIDDEINKWIDQTDNFVKNEYTLTCGVWDDPKNQQMFKDGKTMCFFGPAWYFNFSMGNAHDAEKGCIGDWAICEGPQAHFWGGTWLLAATGTDNPEMLADVMKTFTVDQDVCSKLVSEQNQYPNNKAVVEKFANDASYGSEFLGGQNDILAFSKLAGSIEWKNHTIYDQLLNEGLQNKLQEYWKGSVSKEDAMNNFYDYVNQNYPDIVIPE